MKVLVAELRASLGATLVFAALLGFVYPALVWVAAQAFPHKADGSLVVRERQVVGSELLGQNFTSDKYFAPRPSSAGATGWDGMNSSGSNLGPLSRKLMDDVKVRVADYRKRNGLDERASVPADAVLGSASGLDPHISLKNALLQAQRVARARGLKQEAVRRLIEHHTQERDLGFLGEPRVNVLMLNLALDEEENR